VVILVPRQPVSVANNKKHLTNAEKERRENNEQAVKPKRKGKIVCPDYLDETAKAEFIRMVKEFKDLDILTSIDSTSLAICCDAYSKWKQATEFVNRTGLLKVKENRYGDKTIENNPAIKDVLRYGELYRKMSVECGLTPNARLRLAVKDTGTSEPQDELYLFLKATTGK
jgi:P27 family predicted phage terminase small subunit